jgi:hypothetical protein
MKKDTMLKVAELRTKKALPRPIKDAELKGLAGGRLAVVSGGGTCSDTADCDE